LHGAVIDKLQVTAYSRFNGGGGGLDCVLVLACGNIRKTMIIILNDTI